MTKTLRDYFAIFNYLERRGVEGGGVTSDTLRIGQENRGGIRPALPHILNPRKRSLEARILIGLWSMRRVGTGANSRAWEIPRDWARGASGAGHPFNCGGGVISQESHSTLLKIHSKLGKCFWLMN